MKRIALATCAAAVVAFLPGPAVAQQRGSGWKAPPPSAQLPDELKAALSEADATYEAREKPGQLDKVLQSLRALAQKHPQSLDVNWRLSRAAFWAAESASDKAKKRSLAQEGWDAGKRAIAANGRSPDALYWTSLNIGIYSQAVGLISALKDGLEAKYRDPLLEVAKLEPKIDHGGLWNALGRYKYELPWPKRDLDESVKHLRRAVEVNPQNLRARVYLAESLEDRDSGDDVAEAKRLLAEVLGAPVGRYDTAEELRSKEMAKAAISRFGWDIR